MPIIVDTHHPEYNELLLYLQLKNFRNEIYCRNDSNQHKAKKIWEKIKDQFDPKVARNFQIDWYHYMNNSLDYNGLSTALKELEQGIIKQNKI